MKKYALAIFTLMFASPILASDIPTRAGGVISPGLWEGSYVGINAGYNFSSANMKTTWSDPPLSDERNLRMPSRGIAAGINIGRNYQFNKFVFSPETSISFLSGKASACRNTDYNPGWYDPSNLCSDGGNGYLAYAKKIDFLTTVGGRGGLAFANTLLFISGGVSLGRVSTDMYTRCLNVACGMYSYIKHDEKKRYSKLKLGGYLGVGAEYALTNNFNLRVEYRNVRLASTAGSEVYSSSYNGVENAFRQKNGANIFQLGLSMKLQN